jgi:PAS domain S-box-containing protein
MPTESSIEQQLRAENAELRTQLATARLRCATVEYSDDAIITKSLSGIITSWNRGAERLFGYTAAEVVGGPLSILAPPERLDEMPAILERIRQGEKVDHFETLRRAKDGRLIDVSVTVSPLYDADGNMIGASKIVRDVTEQKRMEAALRESEARWRFALKASNMGAWELNVATQTAWRSLRHAQIFGYAEPQPGWSYAVFLQHVLEEDRAKVDQLIQKALASHENWSVELRIRRAGDQQVRWIWVRGLYLGKPNTRSERVFGLIEDITERKQAEMTLRDNEQRMRLATEATGVGIWEWNIPVVNENSVKLHYPHPQ